VVEEDLQAEGEEAQGHLHHKVDGEDEVHLLQVMFTKNVDICFEKFLKSKVLKGVQKFCFSLLFGRIINVLSWKGLSLFKKLYLYV